MDWQTPPASPGNRPPFYLQMVKDVRTGYSTPDASGVLDGDLDAFSASFLRWKAGGGGAGDGGG